MTSSGNDGSWHSNNNRDNNDEEFVEFELNDMSNQKNSVRNTGGPSASQGINVSTSSSSMKLSEAETVPLASMNNETSSFTLSNMCGWIPGLSSLFSSKNSRYKRHLRSDSDSDNDAAKEAGSDDDEDVFDTNHDDVIIRLENVHKTYLLGVEGIPALRGVDLSIRRGEFLIILGTSGGGKTSMLNVIGTIDRPTKGSVTIGGIRVANATPDAVLASIRLKHIGFVFQTFNLLSSLSALENVEVPMVMLGHLSISARRRRAIELLTHVGMGDRLYHRPNQLSGGEQQRVTIARAMANNPDLLLLDEPTGDLDTKNSDIIMDMLCQLNDQGVTLIMVTHDVCLKGFGHRVVHMRDGKIQRQEIIPEQYRCEIRRELKEQIQIIEQRHLEQHKNSDGTISSEDNVDDLRTGITSHSNASSSPKLHPLSYTHHGPSRTTLTTDDVGSSAIFEVRQPSDYATIRIAQRFEELKVNNSNNNNSTNKSNDNSNDNSNFNDNSINGLEETDLITSSDIGNAPMVSGHIDVSLIVT